MDTSRTVHVTSKWEMYDNLSIPLHVQNNVRESYPTFTVYLLLVMQFFKIIINIILVWLIIRWIKSRTLREELPAPEIQQDEDENSANHVGYFPEWIMARVRQRQREIELEGNNNCFYNNLRIENLLPLLTIIMVN